MTPHNLEVTPLEKRILHMTAYNAVRRLIAVFALYDARALIIRTVVTRLKEKAFHGETLKEPSDEIVTSCSRMF